MSRIDALAEDLIGRCEPGPAGTCRVHHLDRDEDGHCPEWRRAVSEIDDLLEQVRSEAGANRSVIAAHDAERQRALRERDEARAEMHARELHHFEAEQEAARLRDELAKARAEVARLRAGIGTLSDWYEAKAEKADRYPGPGRDNRVAMSKAATVHRDASRRLRALLDPTEGEDR